MHIFLSFRNFIFCSCRSTIVLSAKTNSKRSWSQFTLYIEKKGAHPKSLMLFLICVKSCWWNKRSKTKNKYHTHANKRTRVHALYSQLYQRLIHCEFLHKKYWNKYVSRLLRRHIYLNNKTNNRFFTNTMIITTVFGYVRVFSVANNQRIENIIENECLYKKII